MEENESDGREIEEEHEGERKRRKRRGECWKKKGGGSRVGKVRVNYSRASTLG